MHLSSICHESETQRDVMCKWFKSYKTAVSWQSVDRFSSSHITYDASTHSLFQLLFHPLENKQQQHKPHFSGINLHLPSTAGLKHNQTGGLSPSLSSDVDPLLSSRECVGLSLFAADWLPLRLKRVESFFYALFYMCCGCSLKDACSNQSREIRVLDWWKTGNEADAVMRNYKWWY